MSIEDKIADLLKESEALQMAEASCNKTKMKESDDEDEDDLDEAEENPTGIKIYHKDKTGKASHTIAFTHQDAARVHKEVAKSGGKVTHHALMFGTKEGPKQALSEDFDEDYILDLDEAFAVHRHGGSIGSGGPSHVKTHETKEDAKEHAKRLNKGLSPGEKKYYGIKYKVSETKDGVKEGYEVLELDEEQLDELSKKTLGSYVKKASAEASFASKLAGAASAGEYSKDAMSKEKQHSDLAKKRKAGINTAVNKLTKEDIDADVDALMNGENLTEEFREKATAIFEAAVMSRVTQEVETLEEEFQERLVEYYEGAKEEIVEKVDGYLNYVVEQWMNDNELAVTTGIKNDILEGFVSGMKNLFQEHYIEVPDEKLDLVAELQESVATLESKLDESLESNVTMSKYINYVERNTITEEFCKSMTDTEVEKFKSLAEELSFEDSDTYSSKLQIIKENYFGKKTTGTIGSIVTDSPVQLTESVQNIDPNVAQYLETFNRIKI